jgi:hypothetical protein
MSEGLSMKAKIAEFKANGVVYYVYNKDGVMFIQRTEIIKRRNNGPTQQDRREEIGGGSDRTKAIV